MWFLIFFFTLGKVVGRGCSTITVKVVDGVDDNDTGIKLPSTWYTGTNLKVTVAMTHARQTRRLHAMVHKPMRYLNMCILRFMIKCSLLRWKSTMCIPNTLHKDEHLDAINSSRKNRLGHLHWGDEGFWLAYEYHTLWAANLLALSETAEQSQLGWFRISYADYVVRNLEQQSTAYTLLAVPVV